jgi:hypothetical protein
MEGELFWDSLEKMWLFEYAHYQRGIYQTVHTYTQKIGRAVSIFKDAMESYNKKREEEEPSHQPEMPTRSLGTWTGSKCRPVHAGIDKKPNIKLLHWSTALMRRHSFGLHTQDGQQCYFTTFY